MEALGLAFANKLETSDNKALRIIAKLHLPLTRKKASATRKVVASTDNLVIGNTYVMDTDVHNAYFGLTTDATAFENLIKDDLGKIITNTVRENGIKGDEFTIDGTYYENEEHGASKKELKNSGGKVASAVNIISGPNKGKRAIIVHHADLDNTAEVTKSLYEIS
jgi:hypothetical protein